MYLPTNYLPKKERKKEKKATSDPTLTRCFAPKPFPLKAFLPSRFASIFTPGRFAATTWSFRPQYHSPPPAPVVSPPLLYEPRHEKKLFGVTFSEDLQWKTHIDNITAKAPRKVGFLRRNLYNCTKEVREATYCTLVHPTLKYVSAVWDPFRTTDINRLEQVQRKASRFVHRNY